MSHLQRNKNLEGEKREALKKRRIPSYLDVEEKKKVLRGQPAVRTDYTTTY